jgi:hypothetical protein
MHMDKLDSYQNKLIQPIEQQLSCLPYLFPFFFLSN